MADPADVAVAAVFDRAAEVYDTAIPFFARFGRRLVELAEVHAGDSVLDVASGRGASLVPAAEAVGPRGRVVGVDLAPKMVELLQADLERFGLVQASVRVGDSTRLDFDDAEFDLVLCGFTLMLLPEPSRAAAELVRVLRPDGRIAVSIPTGAGPEWSFYGELIAQFAPRAVLPLPQPPRTPPDLLELLRDVGLEDVRAFDEIEDFVFANADEWWRWVWSQGMRAVLDALPSDAVAELRDAAEKRLGPITRTDGSIPLHQRVRYVTGRNPTSL